MPNVGWEMLNVGRGTLNVGRKIPNVGRDTLNEGPGNPKWMAGSCLNRNWKD
jgi:hypothetical protein